MLLRLVNYRDKSGDDQTQVAAGFLCDHGVACFTRVAEACQEVKSACDCPGCWESALGIAICPACLAAAQQYADWFEKQNVATQAGLCLPLDHVRLLSPVLKPGKVFCLAQNFPSHAAEASAYITQSGLSRADAMTPHVFLKPSPNTICGDGDPILISPTSQFVDYEAELVIVIGKAGKYISRDEAAQYIAGVTAMNDVSERKLKIWERQEEREWDHFFDWLNGKWMDNSAPMGPCLVAAKDLNVDDLDVKCIVNGELRQQGNTSEMYHSAAHTIEYISHMLTLEPGDVIAMGTPGGVGVAKGIKLVPGDVVEVEVEGVGRLTNTVVGE